MVSDKDAVKNIFIVGAGFSHYAGLPLTANFTEALLDVGGLKPDGPSDLQVQFLKEFVADTFDHLFDEAPKYWPHLEDVFTCIDLSANTGHHLGPGYAPSDLRTVRRALIVRIIRMLNQRHNRAKAKKDTNWLRLEEFFSRVDPDTSAFLSMNWDSVIEEGMSRAHRIRNFDYGCDALHADFGKPDVRVLPLRASRCVRVLKPHGSANWLYCDSCRQLFWFDPSKTETIAAQLFETLIGRLSKVLSFIPMPDPM